MSPAIRPDRILSTRSAAFVASDGEVCLLTNGLASVRKDLNHFLWNRLTFDLIRIACRTAGPDASLNAFYRHDPLVEESVPNIKAAAAQVRDLRLHKDCLGKPRWRPK